MGDWTFTIVGQPAIIKVKIFIINQPAVVMCRVGGPLLERESGVLLAE